MFSVYPTLGKLYQIGEMLFHLIGKGDFHVQVENETFIEARAHYCQKVKLENLLFLFGRQQGRNATVVIHELHGYYSSFNKSSLIRSVVFGIPSSSLFL